jgi:hypothetical protein
MTSSALPPLNHFPELHQLQQLIHQYPQHLRAEVLGHISVKNFNLPIWSVELGSTNPKCNGLIEQDTLIGSIYTATRGVYESNKVNEKADLQFRI